MLFQFPFPAVDFGKRDLRLAGHDLLESFLAFVVERAYHNRAAGKLNAVARPNARIAVLCDSGIVMGT